MTGGRYPDLDPLGPTCPTCRRPLHKGFTCYEVGEREREGMLADTGALCPVCRRNHPPRQQCPLRQPEEEAEYVAVTGRMAHR